MADVTRWIGLSLGADICWPICYEQLLRRLDLALAINGDTVRLAGSGTDPEGRDLTYEWVQTGGPTVELDDPTSDSPSFTAPEGTEDSDVTFELRVSDGTNVSADTMDVTVNADDECVVAGPSAAIDAFADATLADFLGGYAHRARNELSHPFGNDLAPLLLYDAFEFSITQASLLMVLRTASLTLASPLGGSLGERFGERLVLVEEEDWGELRGVTLFSPNSSSHSVTGENLPVLAKMREEYRFNDLIGASAIHAVLNPAMFDISKWSREGISSSGRRYTVSCTARPGRISFRRGTGRRTCCSTSTFR